MTVRELIIELLKLPDDVMNYDVDCTFDSDCASTGISGVKEILHRKPPHADPSSCRDLHCSISHPVVVLQGD